MCVNSLTVRVNTSKCKVMSILGKVKINSPTIYHNEKQLDSFENFKFLGIHIAKNKKLTIGVKKIWQQAACAQTTLDLHIIKHLSVLLQHIFELYIYLYFRTFIKYNIMVIYRVD